jgi:TIR domain
MTAFISYSRADLTFALKLMGDLNKRRIDVWLDQADIRVGRAWEKSVAEAIESAQFFLVLLSPDSVISNNVADELSVALDRHKLVIPLLLKPCEKPLRINRLQHIDFGQDYAAGLDKLVRLLQQAANSHNLPRKPMNLPTNDVVPFDPYVNRFNQDLPVWMFITFVAGLICAAGFMVVGDLSSAPAGMIFGIGIAIVVLLRRNRRRITRLLAGCLCILTLLLSFATNHVILQIR